MTRDPWDLGPKDTAGTVLLGGPALIVGALAAIIVYALCMGETEAAILVAIQQLAPYLVAFIVLLVAWWQMRRGFGRRAANRRRTIELTTWARERGWELGDISAPELAQEAFDVLDRVGEGGRRAEWQLPMVARRAGPGGRLVVFVTAAKHGAGAVTTWVAMPDAVQGGRWFEQIPGWLTGPAIDEQVERLSQQIDPD